MLPCLCSEVVKYSWCLKACISGITIEATEHGGVARICSGCGRPMEGPARHRATQSNSTVPTVERDENAGVAGNKGGPAGARRRNGQ